MSVTEYAEGLFFLLATFGLVLTGAAVLFGRRFPGSRGAEAIVIFGLLATMGLLVVHVTPAVFGVLTRGTVVVAALLWLGAASRVPAAVGSARDESANPEPPEGRAERAARLLAGAAVAAIGLLVLAFARSQLVTTSSSIDFATFHLPNVAEWIQTGSIWQVSAFLPDVAPGNYPNSGDVILLSVTLPWSNDFLAQLSIYPFYLLGGVAIYALARELGARAPAAATAACLVLALPALIVSSLSHGIVDAILMFGFASGCLFLVRWQRTRANADLVLAGLALGLAFGTKWYGISSVFVVVAVWVAAGLLARRPLRRLVRDSVLLGGVIMLVGGIWLLRNLIISGNPFFPVALAPGGLTIFDAPPDVIRERAGDSISDYLGDWDAWREFIVPAYRRALAAPGLLLVAGGIMAGAVWARARLRPGAQSAVRPSSTVGVALLLAPLLVAVYSVTPYTAGGPEIPPVLVGADSRYLLPAMIVLAGLAAWVGCAYRWLAVAFGALGLVAVLDGVICGGATSCVGDSTPVSPVDLRAEDLLFAVVVAGLAVALFRLRGRLRALAGPGGSARPLAAAALVGGLVILAGVGYKVQERYTEDRFAGADAAVDGLIARAPSGARIGLAGLWTDAGISPILPAFGPTLDNTVEYVGRLEREVLRRYGDRGAFLAAVDRSNYDLLIVGHTRPPLPPPLEGDWLESAGYTELARSNRLALYAPPATTP